MSERELARRLDAHPKSVQDARKNGRIKFADAKSKRYDPEKAMRDFKRNCDLSKKREPKAASKPDPADEVDFGGVDFYTARAEREKANAELAKLKLRNQSSQLVPVADVKDEWFRIARTVRDALMNAPDRLSAKLAAVLGIPTADFRVHAILADEIRVILEELSNAENRNGFGSTGTDDN